MTSEPETGRRHATGHRRPTAHGREDWGRPLPGDVAGGVGGHGDADGRDTGGPQGSRRARPRPEGRGAPGGGGRRALAGCPLGALGTETGLARWRPAVCPDEPPAAELARGERPGGLRYAPGGFARVVPLACAMAV